jgi:hypothetical protein
MNLVGDKFYHILLEKGILGEEASQYAEGDGHVDLLCLPSPALAVNSSCQK